MTNERAAEILNPTHYEDYDSLETVQEACRMGMVALKMQIPEVPLAPGAIFDFTCSIVLFGGELDDDDPCNMCDDVGDNMVEIMEQKLARWKYRLMKKEAPNGPEE